MVIVSKIALIPLITMGIILLVQFIILPHAIQSLLPQGTLENKGLWLGLKVRIIYNHHILRNKYIAISGQKKELNNIRVSLVLVINEPVNQYKEFSHDCV
jgi:hypothetical protein